MRETLACRGYWLTLPPRLLPPARGAGRPTGRRLPPGLRRALEDALGVGLGDVRIHVGPEAGRLGVAAFACGPDLYFAPGCYAPQTPRGRCLLGHELAHVLQHRQGRTAGPWGTGVLLLDPALEEEADELATRIARITVPREAHALGEVAEPDPAGPAVVQCIGLWLARLLIRLERYWTGEEVSQQGLQNDRADFREAVEVQRIQRSDTTASTPEPFTLTDPPPPVQSTDGSPSLTGEARSVQMESQADAMLREDTSLIRLREFARARAEVRQSYQKAVAVQRNQAEAKKAAIERLRKYRLLVKQLARELPWDTLVVTYYEQAQAELNTQAGKGPAEQDWDRVHEVMNPLAERVEESLKIAGMLGVCLLNALDVPTPGALELQLKVGTVARSHWEAFKKMQALTPRNLEKIRKHWEEIAENYSPEEEGEKTEGSGAEVNIADYATGKVRRVSSGVGFREITITIAPGAWSAIVGNRAGVEQIKGILASDPVPISIKSKQKGFRGIKPEPYGWIFSTSFNLRLVSSVSSASELLKLPDALNFDHTHAAEH
jgi:hypothetical protein